MYYTCYNFILHHHIQRVCTYTKDYTLGIGQYVVVQYSSIKGNGKSIFFMLKGIFMVVLHTVLQNSIYPHLNIGLYPQKTPRTLSGNFTAGVGPGPGEGGSVFTRYLPFINDVLDVLSNKFYGNYKKITCDSKLVKKGFNCGEVNK